MANCKASSSSKFVFVTTALLLLAVIINLYPAPAAASLEPVGEVPKDQGTTEVAVHQHLEIRGRELLPNINWIPKQVFKGATPYTGRVKPPLRYVKPSPRAPTRFDNKMDNYQYLDMQFCPNLYCYTYTSYAGSNCQCSTTYNPGLQPCTQYNVLAQYCCQGSHTSCTFCCGGPKPDGHRSGIFP